jgi:hypothetical protein
LRIRPSNVRVYQFHHPRTGREKLNGQLQGMNEL